MKGQRLKFIGLYRATKGDGRFSWLDRGDMLLRTDGGSPRVVEFTREDLIALALDALTVANQLSQVPGVASD